MAPHPPDVHTNIPAEESERKEGKMGSVARVRCMPPRSNVVATAKKRHPPTYVDF